MAISASESATLIKRIKTIINKINALNISEIESIPLSLRDCEPDILRVFKGVIESSIGSAESRVMEEIQKAAEEESRKQEELCQLVDLLRGFKSNESLSESQLLKAATTMYENLSNPKKNNSTTKKLNRSRKRESPKTAVPQKSDSITNCNEIIDTNNNDRYLQSNDTEIQENNHRY
ncbi:hypothetical protein [Marinomonas sp. 2405UD68-3]|uniref:hypothetical protein n=1 Tax=Marinomonas sp. 2405UD68-3 TaxID=3391835 RepID=UPI0039C8C97B